MTALIQLFLPKLASYIFRPDLNYTQRALKARRCSGSDSESPKNKEVFRIGLEEPYAWSYYPHRSRNSLSLVCGIFLYWSVLSRAHWPAPPGGCCWTLHDEKTVHHRSHHTVRVPGKAHPQPDWLSLLQGGCRERSSSGDHLLGREGYLLGRGGRGQGGRRASLSEHGGQTKGDHMMYYLSTINKLIYTGDLCGWCKQKLAI